MTGEALQPSTVGTETVGRRVQADRDGFWYLGTIVAQPQGGRATDKWTVQCDADPEGVLYAAERVRVWSSSAVGCAFAGHPDYHYPDARFAQHDLPTAMSMAARNPTLLGFNVQLVAGSRAEYRETSGPDAGTWKKATVDGTRADSGDPNQLRLLDAHTGEARVVGQGDVRCDLDDREAVWRVVFVRRGAGKVSRIPAPALCGHWAAVHRGEPLLPALTRHPLFQDGWSGDNARCRIVDHTTGPGNTRATGQQFYVGWKRPGRGEGLADGLGGLALFRSLRAADVEQGSVGNCWFMSAVAAVAHAAPECIRRLFVQQELSPTGRYDVRLWSLKESRWVTHTIDDRLPVLGHDSPSGLQLAYAKISGDDELWPCLLEKAMAKHMGGYAAMDGGSSTFALGAVLGCPADKLVQGYHCDNGDWNLWKMKWSDDHASDPENYDAHRFPQDELLDVLTHSSDLLMCAFTPGAACNPRDIGLSGGHVYSILEVRRDVAGQRGLDMVRLRDPRSYGACSGYTGEWTLGGDSVRPSPQWAAHPEVRRALLHDADSPETELDEPWAAFWMPFAEFCRYFGGFDIATRNLVRGPDDMDTDGLGSSPGTTEGAEVGTRVHVKKGGEWWQGSVVGMAGDDESSWAVQCDADPAGQVTVTKDLLTWVEPGNGSWFSGSEEGGDEWVYERERHDVPTAMAIVLRTAETVGFNLQFEAGSRVECKHGRAWVKGRIVALPGGDHGDAFRVRLACDRRGHSEVYTSNVRYDMSDTETVWNTVVVRKGARVVDRDSAARGVPKGEFWTCLMPKSGPLWHSFFGVDPLV